MTSRFWRAYVICIAVIGAIFGFVWWRNPTTPDATGNVAQNRTWVVLGILIIPAVLAALRARKLTDPTGAAQWALPVTLAVIVGFVVVLVGFLPDDPATCSYLGRFSEVDESCATTSGLRWHSFLEAMVLWAIFGGLTFLITRKRSVPA